MDIKSWLLGMAVLCIVPLIVVGFMLLLKWSIGVMKPSIVQMENLSIELQSNPRVLLITDTKTGVRYKVTLSDPGAPTMPLEAVRVPK